MILVSAPRRCPSASPPPTLFFRVRHPRDILKIHKWYSTENYANDIVLIKLNQQDKSESEQKRMRIMQF